MVKKKNGDYRLVVNYSTGLDDQLPGFKQPIPDEIYSRLSGSRVYPVIDVSRAFHQFVLTTESRKLTTISTIIGFFEYIPMFQGLKTVSSDFQEVREEMCSDLDSQTS